VPRRSGGNSPLQGDGGVESTIAAHQFAWLRLVPGNPKNVLLTGAAGNMALFYDAQIDIKAVQP
jgi:hypothetical protein